MQSIKLILPKVYHILKNLKYKHIFSNDGVKQTKTKNKNKKNGGEYTNTLTVEVSG